MRIYTFLLAPIFWPTVVVRAQNPPCYLCGGDTTATFLFPDKVIPAEGQTVTCGDLFEIAVGGSVPVADCTEASLSIELQTFCGCSNLAPVAVPVVTPTVPVAVPFPVNPTAPVDTTAPFASPSIPPVDGPTPAASPATVTTTPSTVPITASPSTATLTTTPSAVPITARPSTATVTTTPSAVPITATPSTTTVTTTPSAVPITATPSTTTVTTTPSTAPITAKPSILTSTNAPINGPVASPNTPTSSPTVTIVPFASPSIPPVDGPTPGASPSCYLCDGDASATFLFPDKIIPTEGASISCGDLFATAISGGFPEADCAALSSSIELQEFCGCSNLGITSSPAAAPIVLDCDVPINVPNKDCKKMKQNKNMEGMDNKNGNNMTPKEKNKKGTRLR